MLLLLLYYSTSRELGDPQDSQFSAGLLYYHHYHYYDYYGQLLLLSLLSLLLLLLLLLLLAFLLVTVITINITRILILLSYSTPRTPSSAPGCCGIARLAAQTQQMKRVQQIQAITQQIATNTVKTHHHNSTLRNDNITDHEACGSGSHLLPPRPSIPKGHPSFRMGIPYSRGKFIIPKGNPLVRGGRLGECLCEAVPLERHFRGLGGTKMNRRWSQSSS